LSFTNSRIKPASSGLLIVLNPASYQFNLVPVPKRNHVFIMSATEIAEDKNESRFERWWIIDASLEIGVGQNVTVNLILIHELAVDRASGKG